MWLLPMKTKTIFKQRGPEKTAAYGTLCLINQSFEGVLVDLDSLERLTLFHGRLQREFIKACRITVEETRAWANFEITEVLNGCEERDWTRFGRLRRQLERKLEDPKDALIDAARVKRKPRRKGGNETHVKAGKGRGVRPD
jgi:hypothetical protein